MKKEGDAEISVAARHGAAKYQGKKLAFLVLAICVPAGLLYLRLVFGLAATESRVTAEQARWLGRLSVGLLPFFFLAEGVGAWYVQQFLTPPAAVWKRLLQYVGIFLFCLLLSLAGAITLEGFGMNFFLRTAGAR